MSTIDYTELVTLTAEYLGISDDESKAVLEPFVRTAAELLTAKTGESDIESCEMAKEYIKFTAAVMYADRFGELNNKEGSAMKQQLDNIGFILRLKNGKKAAE